MVHTLSVSQIFKLKKWTLKWIWRSFSLGEIESCQVLEALEEREIYVVRMRDTKILKRNCGDPTRIGIACDPIPCTAISTVWMINPRRERIMVFFSDWKTKMKLERKQSFPLLSHATLASSSIYVYQHYEITHQQFPQP